jgi:hypothetical protein
MSVILHTDVSHMRFVHFLLKLKQLHNLKNRVYPHIISDYMENPRPTFFVNSLENSTISIDTLCVKNLRKIGHFEICVFVRHCQNLRIFSCVNGF